MKDPQTDQEWMDAVEAAEFFLRLESARSYGLIEGGPEIDTERCEEILRRGRELGIKPTID